jgi:EmrB/QacA subfamily drug resistance transporter
VTSQLTIPRRSSPSSKWLILVFIGGAQLMIVLDTTIMLIALPTAQHALGISTAGRQWVITAYTLGFGGLLLLGGRLSDLFGARLALITGVIGFALASALGGAAPDLGVLVTARALQGGFAALTAPAVLALLMTTFTDERERGTAFGIWAAIATGGAALGLVLGGVLTQYLGWRWCLYVNVPISVVVAFGVARTVPSLRHATRAALDVSGSVLGCGGIAALVIGLGNVASSSWGSDSVIIPLVVAAVALWVFVAVQRRVKNPLLPLRILANRNRGGSYLSITLVMCGYYGAFLFLTYILQGFEHFSPVTAGFAFLPLAVINGFTSTRIASRLLVRIPVRGIVVPGLLLGAAGASVLALLSPGSSYGGQVLPAELLLGIGLGLSVMPLFATATRESDPGDTGATGAAANTSQQVGASIGTAVFNSIAASVTAAYLAAHGTGSIVEASAHGYRVGSIGVAIVLVAAAFVAGVFITSRPAMQSDRGATPSQLKVDSEAMDLTYEPEA